jgi:hypothetical protein
MHGGLYLWVDGRSPWSRCGSRDPSPQHPRQGWGWILTAPCPPSSPSSCHPFSILHSAVYLIRGVTTMAAGAEAASSLLFARWALRGLCSLTDRTSSLSTRATLVGGGWGQHAGGKAMASSVHSPDSPGSNRKRSWPTVTVSSSLASSSTILPDAGAFTDTSIYKRGVVMEGG